MSKAEAGKVAAPSEASPETLVHLQMIQGVITRMASSSFAVKQWAVAMVAVVAGLDLSALGGFSWSLLVPLAAFWLLDAYYLDQERGYRDLYEYVRSGRGRGVEGWSALEMRASEVPSADRKQSKGLLDAATSKTVWMLYAVLILAAVLGLFFRAG